mgnify:CR=1 FL=1
MCIRDRPFTTSTLQQSASSKLGFGASRTMQIAQRLYQGIDIEGETIGLITYMRTDGTNISKEAINVFRDYIENNYGKDYLPDEANNYSGKKAKNAQEAHEAIRPTEISRSPNQMKKYLSSDQYKLYNLIWSRALSSQMQTAKFDRKTILIESEDSKNILKASGSVIKFDGFLKLYKNENDDEDEKILSNVNKGPVNIESFIDEQHFTQPPPRYSEASLVKKLEELGIGRPSTYASIISVIANRGYADIVNKRFFPTDRGKLISAFLEKLFTKYVDYNFTADLENQLDEISDGKLDWKEVLRKFWETFKQLCDETVGKSNREVIDVLDEALGPHFFPPNGADEKRKCPTCDNGRLGIKVGKFGGFIGCSNYPDCKYTVQFNQLNDKDGAALSGPKEIGIYPETGEMITLRKGPYGFYMQVGEGTKEKKPKRVSIPKNFEPDEIGLNTAIQLLGLPRKLGFHPETNKTVSAGIGMYGPYILHDKKYKALEKTDNILDIELESCLLYTSPSPRDATLSRMPAWA